MRKSWEIKELDTICEINYGTRVVNKRDGGSTYPVFGGGGATFFMDSYNREDCFIVARFAMSKQCTRFVSGKFFLNDSGLSVKPKNNELLQDFLNMQLFYLNDYIYSLSKGAAQKNLDVPIFRKIKITYPKSITEQQEIVSIINDAFESIERAKSYAERNLKNAKELFESYLQGVFKNKGEDWEEKTLEEISDVEYGYTDMSNEEGYYRYIRITDIDKDGELILSDKKYINYSKEASNFLIQENDLLMARTGATFAKVLLYNGNEPSVFASYLIRIKFKVDIENELYWYFTKTPNYWDQANRLQSGAAQPHFNGAAVKQVVFPYPKSILVQKKIIHSFQQLSIETKKLESIYQQKLNDLEELKKSILQKAFNGELKTSKISA
jgi:type I restriction enzyme S subunit